MVCLGAFLSGLELADTIDSHSRLCAASDADASQLDRLDLQYAVLPSAAIGSFGALDIAPTDATQPAAAASRDERLESHGRSTFLKNIFIFINIIRITNKTKLLYNV